jgi:hypothetical protein
MLRKIAMFVILLGSIGLQAQKQIVWFDAGLKAQYGPTGFYNSKMAATGSGYNYAIATGYSLGGKLGINWEYNGLAIDVMTSNFNQLFTDSPSDNDVNYNWRSLDIYTLFRNAKNLGYFEVGPKISLINEVKETENNTTTAVTESYNKNVVSGVLGFGMNLFGQKDGRFSGIIGARFEYGLTDFVSEAGKATGAPTRNAGFYSDGYAASNIAFAGLVFEFNWGIGYFGRAKCGARSKFIMF